MFEIITNVVCTLLSCNAALSINNNVFYRIYNESVNDYTDVPSGSMKELSLNTSRSTIIFVHGWKESTSNDSAITIISALFCHGGDNLIIALDWSDLASANYISAAESTTVVGNYLANDLRDLMSLGLNLANVHLIGFSLGAHIVGLAGSSLKSSGSGVVKKITALDAANPCFYLPLICLGCRAIQSTDAEITQAYHTDGSLYGVAISIATVDFYLNNGTRTQPGCPAASTIINPLNMNPADRCSHDRSWKAHAEAICNRTSQVARKCDSYNSFTSGSCSKNPTVSVGLEMPTNISGTWYYNTTRNESQLGEGVDGA